jgi:hypothetical protein
VFRYEYGKYCLLISCWIKMTLKLLFIQKKFCCWHFLFDIRLNTKMFDSYLLLTLNGCLHLFTRLLDACFIANNHLCTAIKPFRHLYNELCIQHIFLNWENTENTSFSIDSCCVVDYIKVTSDVTNVHYKNCSTTFLHQHIVSRVDKHFT